MPKTRSGVQGAAAGPPTQAAIKDLLRSLRPEEAKKALEDASKALAAAKPSAKRKADARTQKKAADTAKRAKAAADEAAATAASLAQAAAEADKALARARGEEDPPSASESDADSDESELSSDDDEERRRATPTERRKGLRLEPQLSAEMEQQQERLRAATIASMSSSRSPWASEAEVVDVRTPYDVQQQQIERLERLVASLSSGQRTAEQGDRALAPPRGQPPRPRDQYMQRDAERIRLAESAAARSFDAFDSDDEGDQRHPFATVLDKVDHKYEKGMRIVDATKYGLLASKLKARTLMDEARRIDRTRKIMAELSKRTSALDPEAACDLTKTVLEHEMDHLDGLAIINKSRLYVVSAADRMAKPDLFTELVDQQWATEGKKPRKLLDALNEVKKSPNTLELMKDKPATRTRFQPARSSPTAAPRGGSQNNKRSDRTPPGPRRSTQAGGGGSATAVPASAE